MAHKKRKLSPSQIEELRAEYEALDFYDTEPTDTLAKLLERWHISRPTLYRYRDLWMQEDERIRLERERAEAQERDMEKSIRFLVEENLRLHNELAKLQAKSASA